MSDDSYVILRRLFEEALDVPPDRWDEFVRSATPDEGLRSKLRRLLDAHAHDSGPIQREGAASPGPIAESLQALAPGTRLGTYEIKEQIGQGGMGVVYLAVRADGQHDRSVAIKVVQRGLGSMESLHRFRIEQRALSRLEHSGIARLYDGGLTDDGLPYLVMEFVRGERIDRWCDRRNSSIDERLRLFRQVLSAVQFAHQNLVLHRDLKPSNILVTEDGTAKLLDFGIAKVLLAEGTNPEDARTSTIERHVTLQYASPEQVRGEPTGIRSDVYALGLLLYEMLTGVRPYSVASSKPSEWEKAICEIEPPAPSLMLRGSGRPDEKQPASSAADRAAARGTTPSVLQRKLRGDLDAIVLTALRKEPERRYASVHEFEDDLRRHMDLLPVRARVDGPIYRLFKFWRRHSITVSASAAAAVVLAIATGIAVKNWFDRARFELVAVAKTDEAGRERLARNVADELPDLRARGGSSVRSGSQIDYAACCRDYLAKFRELGIPLETDDEVRRFAKTELAMLELHPEVAETMQYAVLDLCGQLFQSLVPYVEIEREGGRIPYDKRYHVPEWAGMVSTAKSEFIEARDLHGLWPRLRALVESVEWNPLRARVWAQWVRWWQTKDDPSDAILKIEGELHEDLLVWASDLVRLNQGSVAAQPLLERAASEAPSSFWAHYQLARSYWNGATATGKELDAALLTRAIHEIGAAAALQPNSSWAWNNVGVYAVELATYWIPRAEAASANDRATFTQLSENYRSIALNGYKRAIKYAPKHAFIRVNLGNLLGSREPARAEGLYREALALEPASADAADALAALLRKLKRGEDEIAVRERAIEVSPASLRCRLMLAEAIRHHDPRGEIEAWLDAIAGVVEVVEGANVQPMSKAEAAFLRAEQSALEAASQSTDIDHSQRERAIALLAAMQRKK